MAIHDLYDNGIDAVAALFSKTFSGDLAPILRGNHHPMGEDCFIKIIEIGF